MWKCVHGHQVQDPRSHGQSSNQCCKKPMFFKLCSTGHDWHDDMTDGMGWDTYLWCVMVLYPWILDKNWHLGFIVKLCLILAEHYCSTEIPQGFASKGYWTPQTCTLLAGHFFYFFYLVVVFFFEGVPLKKKLVERVSRRMSLFLSRFLFVSLSVSLSCVCLDPQQ